MNHLKIFLIIACMASAMMCRAVDPQYYIYADSADIAVKAENWPRAENLILKALRLEPSAPGNLMLMSNLGLVQLYLDRPDDAVRTLSDALVGAPESLVLLGNRARVFAASGHDREALADYTRMLEIDSASTTALFGRGMIALALTDLETAQRDLTLLEHYDPDSRNTHMAMGTLHMLRREYEAAEIHYTALIDDEPDDEFYLARAICRMMTGHYTEASADLNAGLVLNPENPDLYAQRAMLSKLTYRMSDYDLDMRVARRLGYTD